MPAAEIPPAHVGHGWLAAIVPAAARRFRVSDAALAATLKDAGAELVELEPEVEIGRADEIRGDAETAVVVVAETRPEGGRRPLRALRRAFRSWRARARARAAAGRLRARGYGDVTTLLWMLDRPLPLPGPGAPPRRRLPLWALVVGRRGAELPTVLEAAAEAAGARLAGRPNVRQGVVVAFADRGVLRVALGPARRQLDEQQAAFASLRALGPPPSVAERVPWPAGEGRAGLARWTLEPLLPGATPASLTDALSEQCVDFLVQLYRLDADGEPAEPARRAAVVARHCSPDEAAQLEAIGSRLAQRLAGIRRGFGHGDFWSANLLVEGDRLTGVVDWDYAGGGRLPALDLFHLLANEDRHRRRTTLGNAIAGYLLPSARSGGVGVVRDYCRRIGLDADPSLLTDLVLAYWLDYAARQLELYADRPVRPVWMEDNVHAVLRAAVTGSK